ncbi:lytic transglycosylase domain-containing protein [Shinella zoogloeoides]|uniref:Transglycosylase SLT domain-containing protein n=1 Tax=Shinella zoogloeoides TaxID=352475 RepID=A0A6N8TFK3_SHIZO|nr:lytic transglycosylase domain-containing protein [Shinella zoogloeoides]MXO02032.1 transglycosylase SLT domain-containing protein [Shinella zoogloeoides]UEX81664.1 lytic transglycosylase domain-containing protein [Shinella zoogloeoides]
MRSSVITALKVLIPLFAGKPSHSLVPLGDQTAGARSEGQGRPSAGAPRVPLTAASTLAGWRRGGDRSTRRYAVLLALAALAITSGPVVAVAQSAVIARTAADPHGAHIAEASQRFGIPQHWIRAVLRAESAGDVRAISTAGAQGLMQVMPDTWSDLRVRYRLGRDPYDPRDNILAGTAYLREMWNRYGNVAAMLAAYNAGPGRYDDHREKGRPLPAETRAYVAALLPLLGGAATSGEPERRSEPPPDWRDAPLFIMRATDRRAAAEPSSETPSGEQSGDGRAAVPVRDPLDAEPQRGAMFVARANDQERR